MDTGQIQITDPLEAQVADNGKRGINEHFRQGQNGAAKRDVIALGIALTAVIMFVGTGGSVLPQIVRAWEGTGLGPDRLLVNASGHPQKST